MSIAATLSPTLSQFSELGLKREWKKAGQTLFTKGMAATHIYVVVSGRYIISCDHIIPCYVSCYPLP